MAKYKRQTLLQRFGAPLLAIAIGGYTLYNQQGEDIKAFLDNLRLKNDYVSTVDNTEITTIPENVVIPAITEPATEEVTEPEVTEPVIYPEYADTYLADQGYTFLNVDFDGLNKINEDVVGYIDMPGTSIEYPVLQGTDNEFYLHHDINGNESSPGSIYVNSAVDLSLGDDSSSVQPNTISIYGHYQNSGAMFGKLKKYKDANFVKEHPYGVYYSEDGSIYALEIVAVYVTSGTSSKKTFVTDLDNEGKFNEYMNFINTNSLVRTDVDVELGDKLVALITCSYEQDNYREVVVCKAVKQLTETKTR